MNVAIILAVISRIEFSRKEDKLAPSSVKGGHVPTQTDPLATENLDNFVENITRLSLKFRLKYTQISLLHVSVYDHHQGACTEPG